MRLEISKNISMEFEIVILLKILLLHEISKRNVDSKKMQIIMARTEKWIWDRNLTWEI